MTHRHIYLGTCVLIIIAGVGVSVILHPHSPVCPEDFPDTDAGDADHTAAINQWTNAFYDAHPKATLSEWAAARHAFYVDNHCAVALQRYEEAKEGNADPAAMERVKNGIQQAIDGAAQ
jgi:hypothetical protein